MCPLSAFMPPLSNPLCPASLALECPHFLSFPPPLSSDALLAFPLLRTLGMPTNRTDAFWQWPIWTKRHGIGMGPFVIAQFAEL
jgi:hypothetical protein